MGRKISRIHGKADNQGTWEGRQPGSIERETTRVRVHGKENY